MAHLSNCPPNIQGKKTVLTLNTHYRTHYFIDYTQSRHVATWLILAIVSSPGNKTRRTDMDDTRRNILSNTVLRNFNDAVIVRVVLIIPYI